MKKLLAALLFLPSIALCDTKISNLTPATTMAQSDIVPIVINPGTTPANRIITLQNLSGSIVSTITATSLGALTTSSATATYLNINQGLTQSSATATYLQSSSATVTYCQANGTNCPASGGGVLAGGATSYIQNTSTLQSGATFYVSSGTIAGSLNITGSGQSLTFSPWNGVTGPFITSDQDLTLNLVGGTPVVNFFSGLNNGIPAPSVQTSGSLESKNLYLKGTGFFNYMGLASSAGSNYILQFPASIPSTGTFLNFSSIAASTANISYFDLYDSTPAWTSPVTFPGVTAASATLSGQITAGTYQGGALSTCGDSTHALSWASGSFGCQSITGTGGGGGASSLAVTIGVSRSSPTSDVIFNPNQFSGSISASSITVTLNSSSVTLQGNGPDARYGQLIATQTWTGQNNFQSSMTIVSSGTTPTLSITANGTYGTTNGSSGGFFMDCTGGGPTSGMCSQIYSNAGAQTALDALHYIRANNTAWNEPLLYLSNASTSAQSTLRIDSGWPTVSLIDTSIASGNSGRKAQESLHLGVLRLAEGRNPSDTAFDSAIMVSSMSSYGDVAIGQGYNSATDTQLQVISSTNNVNTLSLSTAAVGGFKITFTTNAVMTGIQSITWPNGTVQVSSPSVGGGSGITALTGDVTASGTGSVAATAAANQPNIVTLAASSTTVSGILKVTGNANFVSSITVPTSQGFTKGSLGVSWDGGGSALTTGTTYWIQIPSTGTITGFTLTANPSGSMTVNVSSSSAFGMTNAGNICASACPALSSASSQTDNTISGWSTSVAKDGWLYFVINTAATSTQAVLNIRMDKL